MKKAIDKFRRYAIIQKLSEQRTKYGGIAQLGEQVTSKATRNRNAASKKLISRKSSKIKGFRFHGGIAQLGERLNGIQEVSGSIPLISTKLKNALSLLSAEVLFIFPAEYISVFCILRHDSCGF